MELGTCSVRIIKVGLLFLFLYIKDICGACYIGENAVASSRITVGINTFVSVTTYYWCILTSFDSITFISGTFIAVIAGYEERVRN